MEASLTLPEKSNRYGANMNIGKLSIQYLQYDTQALGPLSDKLKEIRRWNRILTENMPADSLSLLQHCHIIHADKTTITLIIDSPNWATRVRFLTPTLIAALKRQPEFGDLTTIRHKVAPMTSGKMPQKKVKKSQTPISKKNATLLSHTAETVQHPGLRAVLKRMAKRAGEG